MKDSGVNRQWAWNVAWWARSLALVFLVAQGIVAYGVVQAWLASGELPFPFPGVVTTLLFGYVTLAIGWVVVVGRAPKFFSVGALRWPFVRPRS